MFGWESWAAASRVGRPAIQHFERDAPLHEQVLGLVYLAHSARAQEFQEAVLTELQTLPSARK